MPVCKVVRVRLTLCHVIVSKDALDSQEGIFRITQFKIELNAVEGHQFVGVQCRLDDFSNLFRLHTVRDSRAGAIDKIWVESIHIEADVNRAFDVSNVVDSIAGVENTNVLLLDGLALEFIDVANTTIGQPFEWKLSQVHAASPVFLLHASANRKRSSVRVARLSGVIGVDIWMRVDPDYIQVLELLQARQNRRTRD